MHRRLTAGCCGLLLAFATIAGCGGAAGGDVPPPDQNLVLAGEEVASRELWQKASEQKTLTLYSAYATDKDEAIIEEFTKNTGLEVSLVHLPTSQLLTRLQSEHSGGVNTADVFKAGNEAYVQTLVKDKTLVPYVVPSKDKVQPGAITAEGAYTAWVQSPYTIGFNTAKLPAESAPKSWQELLDPKWRGKIAVPDFAAGGTSIALYRFLREKVSPDYWQRLKAQQPVILPGISPIVDSLTRGEVSIAPVIPANLAAPLDKGAQVDFVGEPAEGLPAYSNFIALVDRAPHPEAAKVFISWTLSKQGQDFVAGLGEYPVRTDAAAPAVGDHKLPARDKTTIYEPDRAEVITQTKAWNDEWDATFEFKR